MDLKGEVKRVKTRDEVYEGHVAIIAVGAARKKLKVPGAREFLGKGVSYCATCDGNFFKGRAVAVVGADNEAGDEALHLAELASKVTLIPHKKLEIVDSVMARLKAKANIEMLPVSEVKQVVGDELVTGLKIARTGLSGNCRSRACSSPWVPRPSMTSSSIPAASLTTAAACSRTATRRWEAVLIPLINPQSWQPGCYLMIARAAIMR